MKTKMFKSTLTAALLLSSTLFASSQVAAETITPIEDVMTSSFFFSPNHLRGYDGEGRGTFRVSTNNPFGTTGGETIYLSFDSNAFSGFSAGSSATLTMQMLLVALVQMRVQVIRLQFLLMRFLLIR